MYSTEHTLIYTKLFRSNWGEGEETLNELLEKHALKEPSKKNMYALWDLFSSIATNLKSYTAKETQRNLTKLEHLKITVLQEIGANLEEAANLINYVCFNTKTAGTQNAEDILCEERNLQKYKTYLNNKPLQQRQLESVLEKTEKLCNMWYREPNRALHYKALHDINCIRNIHAEPSVLVVGGTNRSYETYRNGLEPTDLEIQETHSWQRQHQVRLALIPKTAYQKGPYLLESVNKTVLQHSSETIHTALQLYAESKERTFEESFALALKL